MSHCYVYVVTSRCEVTYPYEVVLLPKHNLNCFKVNHMFITATVYAAVAGTQKRSYVPFWSHWQSSYFVILVPGCVVLHGTDDVWLGLDCYDTLLRFRKEHVG